MKGFSSQDGCVLSIGTMPEGLGLDTVSILALALICLLQKMIPRHQGSGIFLRPMCQCTLSGALAMDTLRPGWTTHTTVPP